MLKKLLGRGKGKAPDTPQRPKTRTEPSATAASRVELTDAEREKLESGRSDSTSWPAGEASFSPSGKTAPAGKRTEPGQAAQPTKPTQSANGTQPKGSAPPPVSPSASGSAPARTPTAAANRTPTATAKPASTPDKRPAPKAPEQPAAAEPEREKPARHSLVGASIVVTGELEASEPLTIAGRVEGKITHTANRLTVAKTGVVKADIDARNVVVEGQLEGNIECRNTVILESTANVKGNISTARISIADGAQFKGKIAMADRKD
jgi:cytoskeletal protein CcmA (bactofilin family)